MGRIYKSQTKLRFRLECEQDITGALSVAIKYIKPSGTTGSWTATVEDATLGIIYYDVANANTLDEEGAWTIWSYVTFSDHKVAAGEPVQIPVYLEGSFNTIRTKEIRGE